MSGNKWRLRSAGHFAERHGLIIIVALGESVLLGLIPVMAMLPALVSLAVLAVVLSALIGYETFRHAEQRRQVRGAAQEH